MKYIIIIASMFFGAFSLNAQEDLVKVKVEGLGCPFCAFGLEKKVKETYGIKKIKIDMETGDTQFEVPADKEVSLESIDQTVTKGGYTAMKIMIERADGSIDETEELSADVIANQEFEFQVAGNCGMCQARIEKTAKSLKGVKSADYDLEEQKLKVAFDGNETNMMQIKKAIAKAGHDTEGYSAKKKDYEELPACCRYERIDQ